MKKLRAFVLCALLLTLLSTSAMAEERGSYSFLELMEVMDAIDDEEAIAAGATHLRIGSAITGPRPDRG